MGKSKYGFAEIETGQWHRWLPELPPYGMSYEEVTTHGVDTPERQAEKFKLALQRWAHRNDMCHHVDVDSADSYREYMNVDGEWERVPAAEFEWARVADVANLIRAMVFLIHPKVERCPPPAWAPVWERDADGLLVPRVKE